MNYCGFLSMNQRFLTQLTYSVFDDSVSRGSENNYKKTSWLLYVFFVMEFFIRKNQIYFFSFTVFYSKHLFAKKCHDSIATCMNNRTRSIIPLSRDSFTNDDSI